MLGLNPVPCAFWGPFAGAWGPASELRQVSPTSLYCSRFGGHLRRVRRAFWVIRAMESLKNHRSVAYLTWRAHKGWLTPTPSCSDGETGACDGQDPAGQWWSQAWDSAFVISTRSICTYLHMPPRVLKWTQLFRRAVLQYLWTFKVYQYFVPHFPFYEFMV